MKLARTGSSLICEKRLSFALGAEYPEEFSLRIVEPRQVTQKVCQSPNPMNKENRQLVIDEPVEFEK